MPNYPVHTIASAPEKSKPALEQLQKAFGVLPNLPAVIANSPKIKEGCKAGRGTRSLEIKLKQNRVECSSRSGLLCAEAGQGLPPFPAPLCPLGASFLRSAPD
jgi:hypothetical protein